MLKPSIMLPQLRDVPTPELRGFMERYFSNDSVRLKPPLRNVLVVEGVTSIVLFREGQFQVELIAVQPGVEIPPHVHDDVESYEVSVSGGINLFVEGKQVGFDRSPRADGLCRDFGKFVPIPHDAPHGGKAGDNGACFLSVQRWRDGVDPTHVGLNWRGATMGADHSRAIQC